MLTRKGMLIFALVCLLALTGGGLAQAGDPKPAPRVAGRDVSDSGGPLNTSGFPISLVSNASGHNHETHPSVAYNSGFMKTYLVVWEQPDAGSNPIVYGRFVGRDGALNGIRYPISQNPGPATNADVAYNPDLDQYLVVYEIGGFFIFGQIIGNTGAPVGSEFEIVAGFVPTDTYYSPAVAYSPTSSKYLVTWRHNNGAFQGIEARTVSGDGSTLSMVWELTGMIASDPELPDVAYTSVLDEFLVVWQKTATPYTDHDIYGRRIQMGTSPGPVGSVLSIHYTSHDETAPAVAAIAKLTGIGQYLVACQSDYGGTILIDGQFVTDGGALDGSPLYVSDTSGTTPSVAGNQLTQEYLVAWIHNPEIHARTISTAGIGGQITPLSGNFPGNPAVANGPDGDFLIAAEDYLTGYPFDIFGYLWGTRLFMPAIMKN